MTRKTDSSTQNESHLKRKDGVSSSEVRGLLTMSSPGIALDHDVNTQSFTQNAKLRLTTQIKVL